MKFDTEICKGVSCPECPFNKGEDGCLLAKRLDEIEIIPEPCEDAVLADVENMPTLPGPALPESVKTFASCTSCIHAADSEDMCILRRCVHAIAELKECYEPKERGEGQWTGYKTENGWKRTDGSPIFLTCSECGGTVLNNGSAHWYFCPHCGARMEDCDERV